MVGTGVLGNDPQALHLDLQEHLATPGSGSEHGAVVAEQGRRRPVKVELQSERRRPRRQPWSLGRHGGQKQARVVVDHVEDLRMPSAGKAPVGDVGLPRLVGQLGFKADQRGARALLRLGDHQPSRRKIRQIVETEGTCSLCRARWWAIVCAPQSCPWESSCSRRDTTSAPPPRACNWDWSAVPWSVAPGPHSRPRGSGPRACRSNCDGLRGPQLTR